MRSRSNEFSNSFEYNNRDTISYIDVLIIRLSSFLFINVFLSINLSTLFISLNECTIWNPAKFLNFIKKECSKHMRL